VNPGLIPEEALLVINSEVIVPLIFALFPPCNLLQLHLVDLLGSIHQSKVNGFPSLQ
jgi:hypothetical protein